MENIIITEIKGFFEQHNETSKAIDAICQDRDFVAIMVGYILGKEIDNLD